MLHNKLPFKVGYELSALPGDYVETHYGYCPQTQLDSQAVAAELHKKYPHLKLKKRGFRIYLPKTYVDGHCIELPSPVCSTLEQVLDFYRDAWKVLHKKKYTPQNPKTVCGGNHLHFDMPDLSLMRAVARDLVNRYYIPWVFTQPDDTDSCSNIIFDNCFYERGMNNWIKCSPSAATHYPGYFFIYHLLCAETDIPLKYRQSNKEYSFANNCGGKTFEFRCVEAPRNEQEFLDQLEFFITYVLWIKKNMHKTKAVMPSYIDRKKKMKIKAKDAANMFYKLLGDMGLDRKRYSKYVKRNLFPRWELGRERV